LDKVRRGWLAAFLAFLLFVAFAAMPFILNGQQNTPWVTAAEKVAPVQLLRDNSSLSEVQLSATAQPIHRDEPPVEPIQVDSLRMAALVAGEDLRLRTLLHHIGRVAYPEVIQGSGRFDTSSGVMTGGTSTLILPGPANYTIADLQQAGAVVPVAQGGFLLVNNVLVGAGASLSLGGPGMPTLLMESTESGFTSLVTWGGTITLTGESEKNPFKITSWDTKTNLPADGRTYGRSYIRAVGGSLNLKYVHASYLGFWSGRTGGVAWTGISSRASTGSAISSTFMRNTYGAFVSRSNLLEFRDDLFQQNQLDGLRLHRGTTNATVKQSAAARNGGNGFVISRGATSNAFTADLAVNNGSNGFLINGQSLVSGASPSGGQTSASVGTVIEKSDAESNARSGILVEGGAGTVVARNIVCSPMTGIAVRGGAIGTFVVGNEVRCSRVAISIGPQVTGTTVSGNSLNNARIGMLIRSSPGVRVMYNQLSGISVFGISVRGQSPGIVGNDNIISGRGFRPIDVRAGATAPILSNSDVTGWQHQSTPTLLAYLRYHPLITTWVAIFVFVMLCAVIVRLRHRPERPYIYTVPWRSAATQPAPSVQPVVAPLPAFAPAFAPALAMATATLSAPRASVSPARNVPPRPRPAPPIKVPEPAQAPAIGTPRTMLWQPFAKFAEAATPVKEPETTPTAKATGRDWVQPDLGGSTVKEGKNGRPRKTPNPAPAIAAAYEAPVVPTPKPETSAADSGGIRFWTWLAAGNWAGDESRAPRVADQESPA
jgi:hypothetical protein